jgi:hypothetical protein
MTEPDDSWPRTPEPADTVLGQLQRGRGAGFLAVIERPREECHALIRECLLRDTRYDQQTNSRDRYSAELVQRTGFDMEPMTDCLRREEPVSDWKVVLT